MKRLLAMLLVLVMMFSLVACGAKEMLLPAAMTQDGGRREGYSFNEIRCASNA